MTVEEITRDIERRETTVVTAAIASNPVPIENYSSHMVKVLREGKTVYMRLTDDGRLVDLEN